MEAKSIKDEKFNCIYQTYVDSIYKLAVHYTKNEHVAQEITQTTFLKLYTHFDSVDMEYVEGWLITTARNLLFNYSRESKREILEEVLEIIIESSDIVETVESVEDYFIRKNKAKMASDLGSQIFAQLYKENPAWYEAISLVYCLGKPQTQVAQELGITYEVLRSRLCRAKRWIRKNYQEKYQEIMDWS